MHARRGSRTQTKPPPGSRVDFSHPLAQGLVAGWLMNEAAGRRVNNVVDPTLYPIPLNSKAVWSAGDTGPAVLLPDASSVCTITGSVFPLSSSYSIVVGIRPTVSSGSLAVFGPPSSGNHQLYLDFLRVGNWHGGNICFSTSRLTLNTWGQAATTLKFVSGGTHTGKTFVNGLLDGTGTTTTDQTGAVSAIEGYPGSDGQSGNYSYVYLYRRALDVKEIQWLYDEPYAMIQATVRRVYSYSTAAGRLLYPNRLDGLGDYFRGLG